MTMRGAGGRLSSTANGTAWAAREDTRPPGTADGFGNGRPIGQQVVDQIADNGVKQFSHQGGGLILHQVGAKKEAQPIYPQVGGKSAALPYDGQTRKDTP